MVGYGSVPTRRHRNLERTSTAASVSDPVRPSHHSSDEVLGGLQQLRGLGGSIWKRIGPDNDLGPIDLLAYNAAGLLLLSVIMSALLVTNQWTDGYIRINSDEHEVRVYVSHSRAFFQCTSVHLILVSVTPQPTLISRSPPPKWDHLWLWGTADMAAVLILTLRLPPATTAHNAKRV